MLCLLAVVLAMRSTLCSSRSDGHSQACYHCRHHPLVRCVFVIIGTFNPVLLWLLLLTCIAWLVKIKMMYLPQGLHDNAKSSDNFALAAVQVLLIDVALVGVGKEEGFE